MNRLRGTLAAAAVALALVATGCGVVDPVAVSVDDWSISRADFLAQLDALESSPQLAQFVGVAPTGPATLAAGGSNDIDITNANAYAQILVTIELIDDMFRALELPEPDAQEVAASLGQLEQQLSEAVPVELQSLLETLALADLKFQLVQEGLGAQVDDARVQEEARIRFGAEVESGGIPEQTCISVIVAAPELEIDPATRQPAPADPAALAASREKIDAALERLDAGEDFAAVAREVSDDEETAVQGGEFDCIAPGELTPLVEEPLAEVEVGEYSEVIDYGAGYTIVLVRSRSLPTFDDFAAELVPAVRQELARDLYADALRAAAESATISVDPMFGTWNAEIATVELPVGAAPPPGPAGAPQLDDLLGERRGP